MLGCARPLSFPVEPHLDGPGFDGLTFMDGAVTAASPQRWTPPSPTAAPPATRRLPLSRRRRGPPRRPSRALQGRPGPHQDTHRAAHDELRWSTAPSPRRPRGHGLGVVRPESVIGPRQQLRCDINPCSAAPATPSAAARTCAPPSSRRPPAASCRPSGWSTGQNSWRAPPSVA